MRTILIIGLILPLSPLLTQCSTQTSEDISLNRKQNREYLLENGKRADIITTASGLQYQMLTEGTGTKPTATDFVTVNYSGNLINGQMFDKGEGIGFPLNGVIPGWTEGLQLMNQGAKFRFYIPADLAYGDRGVGRVIPPDSTLIFDVELVSIGR